MKSTRPSDDSLGDGFSAECPSLCPRLALRALGHCALRVVALVVTGRLHQPDDAVGQRLRFADGSDAPVYRVTIVDQPTPSTPAVLIVSFRLRRIRRPWAHACFRRESVLNTVLFAGFEGFVSKLWLRHDQHGRYRGLYEWDGPDLAVAYVRALSWVLALVSEPRSISYALLPGLHLEEMLLDPDVIGSVKPLPAGTWWRVATPPEAR